MNPFAVLLGGNRLNRGVLEKFQHLGLKVIVVDRSPLPDLKGDLSIQGDVKNAGEILSRLESLNPMDIRCAWTSTDVAVPTAAAIHQRYGLPVPAGGVSEKPLTKELMISAWKRDGLLNRLSFMAAESEWEKALEDLRDRVVIVKPNLSSSSRGITIHQAGASPAEILDSVRRAREISFDGRALVEEFFAGEEFSIELLGDGSGNVAVYGIGRKKHSPHVIDNRIACKIHYNAASLDESTGSRLAEVARQCYRSLGLRGAVGHLEVLMNEEGVISPVEIGARSGGFIGSPLVDIASGRDLIRDYLGVLGGARVDNVCYRSAFSSMYFFYDFPPGKQCLRETHLGRHLPATVESLFYDRSAIQHKRIYDSVKNESQRYGHEILRGPREALTMEALESAERRMMNELFAEQPEP